MAFKTIEVDIDVSGNITLSPNPVFVGDGDDVFWHIQSNASEGSKFTVTLPGGDTSPFGSQKTETTISAKVCTGSGARLKSWPKGVQSYSYKVSVHGSPVIGEVQGHLIRETQLTTVTQSASYSTAPYVNNNYYFDRNLAERLPVSTTAKPIPIISTVMSSTRSGQELKDCTAFRVWRNQTDGKRERTISVYPHGRTTFPNGSVVTVFVAPDNHQGKPNTNDKPTHLGIKGDSVAKEVPKDYSVFVHYNRDLSPLTSTKVDITQEA